MSDMAVEVFRDDVDALTERLLTVVGEDTEHLPFVDRAIIVAAALANVACSVDAVEAGDYVPECTDRLKNIAASWSTKTNG